MMDPKNLFYTPNTAYGIRADYITVLVIAAVLLWRHREEIDLLTFFVALAWQDAISFYPAAIFYYGFAKGEPRRIPAIFYWIYNIVHGVPLNALVVGAWMWMAGGWRWEMLAIPLHFGIDRGLFGLFYKSRRISFIPRADHDYVAFSRSIQNRKADGYVG